MGIFRKNISITPKKSKEEEEFDGAIDKFEKFVKRLKKTNPTNPTKDEIINQTSDILLEPSKSSRHVGKKIDNQTSIFEKSINSQTDVINTQTIVIAVGFGVSIIITILISYFW